MPTEPRKRSIFALIGDLPGLVSELIRGEVENFKQEITTKLKGAGLGLGLLAGAAAFLLFAIAVLTAAAILGIATALPAWAAALIVGGVLLLIAVLIGLVGVSTLRKSMPPAPTEALKSVKKDVDAIKGIGKRVTE